MDYRSPDKIPLYYHESPAGLYVHGRKLLDLFRRYPPDNGFCVTEVPTPPPGTVDASGRYREHRTDAWGTEWEFNIFGIQGHPKRFPVADLDSLSSYRFPDPPHPEGQAFEEDRARVSEQKRRYLVFRGGASIFEKMAALRPLDKILMDIATEEPRFFELLDRLTDYASEVIRYLLAIGADVVMFGDDWGIQTGPIISPESFDRIFAPRYARLFDEARRGGARILFHSCGNLGPIMDRLLEMGVNCIWHQVNRYNTERLAATCKRHGVSAFIHPDRQELIPRGTPAEIRERIRDYASLYHHLDGGGIFYVEMENDAPFENVRALFEAIDEFR